MHMQAQAPLQKQLKTLNVAWAHRPSHETIYKTRDWKKNIFF